MKIDSPAWRQYLITGASQLGISVDDDMAMQAGQFALELVRWNQRMNLTSIVSPRQIAVKHIIDSLAPARLLPVGAHLVDIGSGAGLPGILLKIFRPDLNLASIEAVRKKCAFQQHVIRLLKLPQIRVIHARAEQTAQDSNLCRRFDAAICRAFTELDRFVDMAMPFLKPHALILAMKGPKSTTATMPHWQKTQFDYRLPYSQDQRSLIVLRRDHTGH